MIEVTAQKTRLIVDVTEQITSGSVNVYTVHFHFGTPWDGLEKVAVFNVPGKTINVPVQPDDTCIIPWEVTLSPGYNLRLGVYGIRTMEVVLPTIWASLGNIVQGVVLGSAGSGEHTPDIYDAILAKFEDIDGLIQELRDKIEEVRGEIPTNEEIVSIILYYLLDNPSSIYPVITEYLQSNDVEIEEGIKKLVIAAIQENLATIINNYFEEHPIETDTEAVKEIINNYLQSDPEIVQQIINDYLQTDPSVVQQIIQQYLSDNPIETLSKGDVQNIIQEYLSENQVGITEERVKELIDESVGAAMGDGY